jgi:hypothetical protein
MKDQMSSKPNAKHQILGSAPCDSNIPPITIAIEYGVECSGEGGKKPTGNPGPLRRTRPSENPPSAIDVELQVCPFLMLLVPFVSPLPVPSRPLHYTGTKYYTAFTTPPADELGLPKVCRAAARIGQS